MLTFACTCCSEYFSADPKDIVANHTNEDDMILCPNCMKDGMRQENLNGEWYPPEELRKCSSCGDIYYIDILNYDDSEGTYTCETCESY